MHKISGKEACQLAVQLIEEQLGVLSLSIAMLLQRAKAGDPDVIPLVHASQRVLISNALLAVEQFLKAHGIATSRTTEIQFLGHVCNAIINANKFRIEPGYVPKASFDGLAIDSTLDGAVLFGDGVADGFMKFEDGIALLEALAMHLRGVQHVVSGGDAG